MMPLFFCHQQTSVFSRRAMDEQYKITSQHIHGTLTKNAEENRKQIRRLETRLNDALLGVNNALDKIATSLEDLRGSREH